MVAHRGEPLHAAHVPGDILPRCADTACRVSLGNARDQAPGWPARDAAWVGAADGVRLIRLMSLVRSLPASSGLLCPCCFTEVGSRGDDVDGQAGVRQKVVRRGGWTHVAGSCVGARGYRR